MRLTINNEYCELKKIILVEIIRAGTADRARFGLSVAMKSRTASERLDSFAYFSHLRRKVRAHPALG
ncbi:hypothetical protein GQR60_02405 [Labilibaculum sp. A4]|uniref:hypothetical protein n=1 Tax=Labilibaculum euxinus TaxID=2686357 RepID=UPI000F62365B|nr:hypothetical protein [Labilibaculum euxinus]MDQ1770600.1 hypothetical protein [Labilibaculum euxinus]MWN75181.1 hypothetical protein [Labilibaculum euxinus]